ncbi:MAG TPA: ABC transporter permease subunit [Gemmatimonadota bacterium]|nr:ABC transporter permease subunit [Gemmatimonadota bacterium]
MSGFPEQIGALEPHGGALIAPRPKGAGKARRAPRSRTFARAVVLLLVLGYLVVPLFAMLEFSTRGPIDKVTRAFPRSLEHFAAIFSYPNLVDGIVISLQIAVLTVVGMLLLLVPTMVWTVVRVPRMRRVVEFLCLLPLAIPAIVIVVGIAPLYRFMGQNLGAFGASPLTLAFINIILVLPYSYRAIDSSLQSIDSATLADASRSLGAGWPRTIFQVIVPNIRGGILSASVLAIALVLGEFTISSLLSFNTVQVVIFLLGKRDPFVSVAVSLLALVFAFVLLFVISRFAPGVDSRSQRAAEEPA